MNSNVALLSTTSSQTTTFNNEKNTLTLTCKYTGSGTAKKFNTTYTPTVSVTAINTISDYFVMSSYTGLFLNSNTSYRVTAKGTLYSSIGIVSTRASFTVTFNV